MNSNNNSTYYKTPKKLVVTEKPSVAQEFAKILGVSGKHDGFIENDEWVITWCVGHLVALLYPESYHEKYRKWTMTDLPFIPGTFKYGVISSVAKQYKVVHTILHRDDIDTCYWAGDAGKEGQVIEENIRRYGGVRKGIKELSIWIDSQTEEEIKRGIRDAKPMAAYDNLANSGIMRAVEDYLMGINLSRVLTCKYGQIINNASGESKYRSISVGRVMTCILGMVVKREREIRNFKVENFYKLSAEFGNGITGEWKADSDSDYYNSPLLYNENGFKKTEDAEVLLNKLKGKNGVIKDFTTSNSKKKAPLLYNLAEIQNDCSKKFKLSPDQTLSIIQSLYEKKLCTYPRTDSRVLSSAVGKVIDENLQGLYDGNYLKSFTGEILNSGLYKNINDTQYVNDKKVSDHYAIIPTGNLSNYSDLNETESSVFDLIVRRFLSIFYPAAEYKNVKAVISIDGENFYLSSKELISEGYLKIISDDSDNAKKSIPELSVGSAISVNDVTIKEGKTSPPKRYTSGSMVLAMENAGQLIEDEELREQIKGTGIGTSATRADILKKLITNKYIDCNKAQVLSPNKFGEMIYEVVDSTIPEFLVPELTARWDKELEMIANGDLSSMDYQNKIEVYVKDTVNSIKEENKNEILIAKIKPFASSNVSSDLSLKCPLCDGRIKKTQYGYCCENYKGKEGGCTFALPGKICDKTLTDKQIQDLVMKKKTGLIKGFKSKSGKNFDAFLAFKDNKIQFDFPAPEESSILCPNCGNKLTKNKYSYDCSCGFKINHVICSKDISEKNIKELLSKKKTGLIKGFKAKSGKNFDAYLIYQDGQIKFEFPKR